MVIFCEPTQKNKVPPIKRSGHTRIGTQLLTAYIRDRRCKIIIQSVPIGGAFRKGSTHACVGGT